MHFHLGLNLVGFHLCAIPYSRKIWQALNLVKLPKMAKIKYWRNLNSAIVCGESYDVISIIIKAIIILAYDVILGAQRATLLNVYSFLIENGDF